MLPARPPKLLCAVLDHRPLRISLIQGSRNLYTDESHKYNSDIVVYVEFSLKFEAFFQNGLQLTTKLADCRTGSLINS